VAASSEVYATASRSSPASAPCSCRPLSHETLLWHHCLGHPSLPRLRCMASRTLVSGLPRSLPPLPPGPTPTCVPCVEGRQRAAPHSSTFPPMEAPLQTLHMDVWGPARVRGQGHERYFLLVVHDYSRYTTVFPLRSKEVVSFPPTSGGPSVVRKASARRSRFRPRHSKMGLLSIDMVMDVARTSKIHAATPHFLWPFAVQYTAHQINVQPRVSLPKSTPTLRWSGKVGDAFAFRVWGSRAFVHDTSADKLSSRAVPCVFLGFPPDAPGWQFYHPTSRRVLSSQDITFDESVSYYYPAESVEEAVNSGAARGAEPAGARTGGAEPGDAEPERVEPGGAKPGGAESGGAEPERAAPGGPPGVPLRREPLSPQQLREWYARRCRGAAGAAGAGRAAGGAPGAGAAGGAAGARVAGGSTGGTSVVGGPAGVGAAGGAGAAGPGGTHIGGTGAVRAGGAAGVGAAGARAVATGGASRARAVGGTGAGGAVGVVAGDPGAEGTGAVSAVSGGAARPRPYYILLLQQVLGLPPSPGPTPPLLSPPPVQSQSQLQPTSPLPGAEPAGARTGGAEPGDAEPERVEPGGAKPGGAESGGAEPERAAPGGPPGVPLRREPLSPQQLREWYARRCRGAAGAAGAGGAAGGAPGAGAAGGAAGAGVAGGSTGGTSVVGGLAGVGAAGGAGAAGPGGTHIGGTGAVRAGGAAGVGAAGARAVAIGGASRARAVGGTGAGGAVGVVAGDPGAEGTGAVSAVSGGAARPRPYYILLLQQVLGLPPSPGPTPPLLSPPPVQSQSQLQPTSPLPGPSPYSGPTRGLTSIVSLSRVLCRLSLVLRCLSALFTTVVAFRVRVLLLSLALTL
ncbi:unnamed protein product, partial [Closterium sp. NIES-53]